jgi:hypothetical protein
LNFSRFDFRCHPISSGFAEVLKMAPSATSLS